MPQPSLFISALLAPAEFTINQILDLDSLVKKQLSSHKGTVLEVACNAPELSVFLIIEEGKIRLTQDWNADISASFKGSASALIGLLVSKGANLHDHQVEVSGDMQKAQTIQQILSSGNIDWEYHLSRIVGDIPTQAFSEMLKKGSKTTKDNIKSMNANIDEYIHEEARWLPGKDEIHSFQERVSEFQLRLDRLNARVNKLDGH